ncbi:nitrogen fixation protein NifM [Psychromonas sp.]|nr:nitrogen fixation protein NifM [Psychromonas sp.]
MLVKEPTKTVVNLQYQLIKLAWSQYQSAPESLDATLLSQLEQQAKVAQKIMTEVLSSEEAKAEEVKQQEVLFLFEELQQQFENKESFKLSLESQNLTEESLQKAIYHDLICEKTLATQSQNYPKVTEEEALTYYEQNKARFSQPERRKVSHLLITINDEFETNERKKALAKIEKLQNRLKHHIGDFANLALQHSECPTSLNKGLIGEVTQGQLYPELDRVLFNMKTGRVSSVVETEIGFHLLLCHAITEAGEMTKADALKEITAQLNAHRQKKVERKWVRGLLV